MTESRIGYAAVGKNQIIPCKYGTKLITEDGAECPIIRKHIPGTIPITTIQVQSVEIVE